MGVMVAELASGPGFDSRRAVSRQGAADGRRNGLSGEGETEFAERESDGVASEPDRGAPDVLYAKPDSSISILDHADARSAILAPHPSEC